MTKGKEDLENRSCKGIILWVDDREILWNLEHFFGKAGFIILSHKSGTEAIESINQGTVYDVAVVDLHLGSTTDGAEVLKVSKEAYPNRKTISISSYHHSQNPNADLTWNKIDHQIAWLIELIK